MIKRNTISVVIPCYNVEKFIRPTLDSIKWCDEVVIVDMFSTDSTKEICSSYPNVKFFENKDFIYANVNFGIEKTTSDWILRLDSDEVITPELRDEIVKDVLEAPSVSYDGFEAQQEVYVMGYRIKHGHGSTAWRGTLFRKGKAYYLAKSEHEDFQKIGKWGRLKNKYQHFTNQTISGWLNKLNYYSDKDVARWDPVTGEKITLIKIIYRTLRWFQRYYIYPGGAYRDGRKGLVVGLVLTMGLLMTYLKQWEKQQRTLKGEDSFPSHPNARWPDQ